MATLFHVGSYRIVVYSNDHSPPHVHAVGDGHAKFDLGATASAVRLTEVDGIPVRDVRRIAAMIAKHHAECLAAWERIHGNQRSESRRRK